MRSGEDIVMFVALVDIRVLLVGYRKCKCCNTTSQTPKGNKNKDQVGQMDSVKSKGKMRMKTLTRESK
jgi:hypothetical protein